MSTLRNKVTLLGNAGMQPEVKSFGENKKLAKFSMATTESYKNPKGEWINNSQWHNIIAWGSTATYIERNIQKGSEVMVEGKLINKTYEAPDGTKKYYTEIEVSEVLILNKKSND